MNVTPPDSSRQPLRLRQRRLAPELLSLAGAAAVYAFMSFARFTSLWYAPFFDPRDDTGLFWTESAFHYRYARIYASGRSLPDPDTTIQYPEGIRPLLDETPVMERFAGWAYRACGRRLPFHVFVLGLACLYSGLTLFPAWLLARVVWRSPAAAFVAVLLYATTFSFIGVVPLGDYVRQDFALPFLFGMTGLYLWSWRRGNAWWVLAAVPLMTVALMAWHMTRFYLALLALAAAVGFLAADDAARRRISASTAVLALATLAAGLGFARLRYTALPISAASLLFFALGLPVVVPLHRISRRRVTGLMLATVAVALAVALRASAGSLPRYDHVYRLLTAKLRYLGSLPADLAALDFEARAMWSSSFTSPGVEEALVFMGTVWLAGIIGAAFLLRRLRQDPTSGVTGLLALAFVPAFFLIRRMDVFLAFFLGVSSGGLAATGRWWPLRSVGRRQLAAALVLLILLGVNVWRLTRFYIVSRKPPPREVAALYEHIRGVTATGDVILAEFQLSPAICLYCNRPVVIHSKFENTAVRRKVREFYTALFRTEDDFYRVCRGYGVDWVVYQPDIMLSRGPGSVRFMAAARYVPADAVACLMHFFPARLRHFVLVYQDAHYRLFKVVESPAAEPRRRFPMLPVYDPRRFNPLELGVTATRRPP